MANDPELTSVLNGLAVELKDIAKSTAVSLETIQKEVAELKDSRFRPYLTSMGLFLVIVLGVMSYVYQMEMKFTRSVFELNDRITDSTMLGTRSIDKLEAMEERLHARTEAQVEIMRRVTGRIERLENEIHEVK